MASQQRKLEDLATQLGRKRIPRDVIQGFLECGDEAYDFLVSIVRSTDAQEQDNSSVDRRAAQALHLLGYLTGRSCFGRQAELLELALSLASHPLLQVRTQAALLVINLTRMWTSMAHHPDHWFTRAIQGMEPLAHRHVVLDALDSALVRGVEPSYKDYIERYAGDLRGE